MTLNQFLWTSNDQPCEAEPDRGRLSPVTDFSVHDFDH